jgi:hypothetical protein
MLKLIPDAAQAYRFWSVRLSTAAAVLGAVEASLPYWEHVLPTGLFGALSAATAMAAGAARVIRQDSLRRG